MNLKERNYKQFDAVHGKRGSTWLTEETAKFILSILVILVLVMLVAYLARIFIQNQEYEQAKATMASIKETVASLNEGQTKTFLVEGPKDWVLVQPFDLQDSLCLCPPADKVIDITNYFTKYYKIQSDLCNQRGVCITSSDKFSISTVCGNNVPNCYQISKLPTPIVISLNQERLLFSPADSFVESKYMASFFLNSKDILLFEDWVNSGFSNSAADSLRKEVIAGFGNSDWCLEVYGDNTIAIIHSLSGNPSNSCTTLKSSYSDSDSYRSIFAFKDKSGKLNTYKIIFRSGQFE